MQRQVNLLIMILAGIVHVMAVGRDVLGAEPWASQTATGMPYAAALGPHSVPPAPSQPAPVARPESWPGAAATPVPQGVPDESPPAFTPWQGPPSWAADSPPPVNPTQPTAPAVPPAKRRPGEYSRAAATEAQLGTGSPVVAEMEPCEGAVPLATVGSEWILAGEVLGSVNELIEQNKDRIPKSQLEEQRLMLVRQKLKQKIETKLIYQDARRTIPKENFPTIEEKLGEYFEKEELPGLMERSGASSRQELEQKLQGFGTSMERERRTFMERALAQQWVQEQIKSTEEINHEQMLAYYQEHLAEYEYPAQARWEQIMVRFSDYPSKADAYAAIAGMGNQVLAGQAFAEVAKAGSVGSTAAQGGQREWTSKGSLVSQALDQALFGLPIGRLSPILEDDQGFHIIRILERKEAGRTPFLEAQVGIREKIREQRRRAKVEECLVRLKEEIPVWTVFDDPSAPNPLAGK